jgi:hypothetical protein
LLFCWLGLPNPSLTCGIWQSRKAIPGIAAPSGQNLQKAGKINPRLDIIFYMNSKNPSQPNTSDPTPGEELEDEVVVKFLKVLETLREEEMTCEEMYAHIDEFVEREVKSHDAEKIMPLIQEHIDLCAECCDEYEALLDVLEHTEEEEQ